jgi:hypothetical protein
MPVIADESPPSFSTSNGLTTHPQQILGNRGGIYDRVNAYTPTYAITTCSVQFLAPTATTLVASHTHTRL